MDHLRGFRYQHSGNWPPKSGQHQELSLRAPEDAVGLLLVKHLCRKKQKPALQCVAQAFQQIPRLFFPTYELDLSVVFDVVEGGADPGRLSVKNGKLAAVGFPCKRYDAFWIGNSGRSGFCLSLGFSLLCILITVLTLHLHHIHRDLLLPHAEDFKVGDHTLKWICEWLNISSC